MTPFEQFFDSNIIYINLARREDRRRNFESQMKQIGIKNYERFDAIDAGPGDGNTGCCASHRAVMKLIVDRGLPRCAVFEDDSVVREQFRDSFHEVVAQPLRELPPDWDLVYFGGGYGDDPQGWHSRHLIKINAMKTTSSYAVTAKAAKELYNYIPEKCGDGIDNIFSGYAPGHMSFITEPRFFYQYGNYSNLQEREMSNQDSMENIHHVTRLGKYVPR